MHPAGPPVVRSRSLPIVLFDQRGCGRSTPHASLPTIDLATNTTHHLLADIERLRRFLGIERWTILGQSWGCTLALAYTQRHPDRVEGLVLVGVTMTRQREIDWLCRGLAPLFPAEWRRFHDGVPADERDGDLVEAYHRLLTSDDPAIRHGAARAWHDWEAETFSISPGARRPERWADASYRLARARIVTHYFRNRAWLADGALLAGAAALNDIPGTMIQGRLDLEAPLVTAWELSRVWTSGELVIVGGAGHSASSAGMSQAIVAATDRLLDTPRGR